MKYMKNNEISLSYKMPKAFIKVYSITLIILANYITQDTIIFSDMIDLLLSSFIVD